MVGLCYDGVEGVLYLCLFSILAACAFTVMLCAIPRAWRQIACRSVCSLLVSLGAPVSCELVRACVRHFYNRAHLFNPMKYAAGTLWLILLMRINYRYLHL